MLVRSNLPGFFLLCTKFLRCFRFILLAIFVSLRNFFSNYFKKYIRSCSCKFFSSNFSSEISLNPTNSSLVIHICKYCSNSSGHFNRNYLMNSVQCAINFFKKICKFKVENLPVLLEIYQRSLQEFIFQFFIKK